MWFILKFRAAGAVAMLLFLFQAGTCEAVAASLPGEIQKAYASINSMRVEFIQILVHKESGSKETRSGVLHYKKPLLVNWQIRQPSPELLVVGPKSIWNVFPDEELAYKYALDITGDSGGIIKIVTGQARLDQDYDLEDESVDGDLRTVRMYPKQPSQAMVEARLWVDSTTFLIKKIKVYDFYGNENEITFIRHEPGAATGAEMFNYVPPKNFLIEDRTKDKALEKPLL